MKPSDVTRHLLVLIFTASAAYENAAAGHYVNSLTSSASKPWLEPYLPSNLEPLHYDIYQDPALYFDQSTFSGRVAIRIKVVIQTDIIIVHDIYLNITSSKVFDENGSELRIKEAFGYKPNEYWVVLTEYPLAAGTVVTLTLEFIGHLSSGIGGFYKNFYVRDLTGTESFLAATYFRPTYARSAFPNFDEPRFKSQFTITLRHWRNFTALTNMPEESHVDIDSVWRETTFMTSPNMSSYLVCFIVCDFAYKNNTLADGKPHRVWVRSDRLDQVDYVLTVGRIIHNFYVKEFGVMYQLPKLDQLGIPSKYYSGQTAHWGLVTYLDTEIFYDPKQDGAYEKQQILSRVANKLAHHFFDNLVTCRYWDDIWLNLGLSVFYGVKGVTAADPKMLYNGQFFTDTIQWLMGIDATIRSIPLKIKLNHPKEVGNLFSRITPSKGGAIITMIHGFLGTSLFNRCLKRYFQDNANGTVVTDDLWTSFQKEIGPSLDIKEVMTTWVYSMGYPVINIEILPGNQIQATQKRFLTDPTSDPNSPPSEYGYKWYVPLNYRTQRGKYGLVWMNQTTVVFRDPCRKKWEWIKFNHDHSGYYRVNYDTRMWGYLTNQLNADHEVFTELERMNLISDGLHLARAEHLSYDVALGLTEYAPGEYGFLPWEALAYGFAYIDAMLASTKYHSLYKSYLHRLTTNIMNRLRIRDTGSHVKRLLRSKIISLSCYAGHEECRKITKRLFEAWILDEKKNAVPLNLRREVYRSGIAGSTLESDWTTAWNRYIAATRDREKDNLLYALSNTKNFTLIDRLLHHALDRRKVSVNAFNEMLSYVISNHEVNAHLWDWFRSSRDDILNRFGHYTAQWILNRVVSNFNTEQRRQEVIDFCTHEDFGNKTRDSALKKIDANIRWMENCFLSVVTWLSRRVSNLNGKIFYETSK